MYELAKIFTFEKTLHAFKTMMLVLFAALLLAKAYSTLHWRIEHDTPVMLYASFLMNKYGFFPYRDIFEISMPGAYAFYYLMGRIVGFGDFAIHCVDLLLLSTLLAATFLFMRRFGNYVAIWSAVIFGLQYLVLSQTMTLQRDYIGVIPIAFALLAIPDKIDNQVRLARFAFIGLMFGLAVLIKPHLGIALPIVFGTLLAFRWQTVNKSMYDLILCAIATGLSLLLPIAIALIWLALNAALSPFMDMVVHYLPLYNDMTGDLEFIPQSLRISYLIQETLKFHYFIIIFLGALFSYYYALTNIGKNKANAISLTCLFLCTLSYLIYVSIAGKFWPYHYVPFAYFCSIATGLCFIRYTEKDSSEYVGKARKLFPMFILLVVSIVQLNLYNYVSNLSDELRAPLALVEKKYAPKGGRVDEIAHWLKSRLQPGDTVQPLDVTGGSVQGMLIAEAKIATKFILDWQFYFHVSSPYIQGLRKQFISQLYNSPPRFVIEVMTDKPWVSGVDTTNKFPELSSFLTDHYSIVFYGKGYEIWERHNNIEIQ
jgi:4-amino-4-deoxy-L-arabinose transferase-like glycosyltransferase